MGQSITENAMEIGTSVSNVTKSVGSKIAKGAVGYLVEKTGIETDDVKGYGVAGV